MTTTKLDLDAILAGYNSEPNLLTQEELIDFILGSIDTETELDDTLIDIDFGDGIDC